MRDIPGFEGRYAAAEDGQIWSYKHKKFLNPKVVNGYCHVDLVDNEHKTRQCLVHRLMAMTYLPNPGNLPEVNHKDECRANNRLDNLEWCTHAYNMNYGTRTARAEASKTAEGWARCREASAEAHRRTVRCVETGMVFGSIREAAKEMSASESHVSRCCSGKRKTCGGYHWEYVEKGDDCA